MVYYDEVSVLGPQELKRPEYRHLKLDMTRAQAKTRE